MSSESEKSSSEEEEYDVDIQFGTLDIKEYNYRSSRGIKFCSCVDPVDSESAIGVYEDMINDIFIVENVNCIFNNIISVCNYFLTNHQDINDYFRLAFVDSYYRLRHELLFKVLLLTLNSPTSKSDIPFSDFGIDSSRTPDFIKVDKDSIVIIEVAATSNFEKTAMLKGSESLGYESKYQLEIDMLRDKNYTVYYKTIIFDMSSYNIDTYNKEIESLKDFFYINEYYRSYLNLVYKEFCTITYNIKSYLFPSSTLLFNPYISIDDNHDNISYLYKNKEPNFNYCYKKFTVSSQVFSKINQIWHRIPAIFESKAVKDDGKFIPVLSITNNRLSFEESLSGFTIEQVRDIVLTNDKPTFFQSLHLSVGNTKFPAMGSETGVEFIEKVKKKNDESKEDYNIPYMVDHIRVKVKKCCGNLDKYLKILSDVNNKKYESIHFDSEYEDLLLKKIKDFDLKCTSETLDHTNYKVNLKLGLLQENNLNNLDISDRMKKVNSLYLKNNDFDDSLPLKIKRMKQSFILPIANLSALSYCSLNHKNVDLYSSIYKNLEGNDYTKAVILKIIDENFSFKNDIVQPSQSYLKLKNEKYEFCNKMTALYKKAIKNIPKESKLNFKLSTDSTDEIKNEFLSLRKNIQSLDRSIDKLAKEEGIKQNIEMIRLPTRNKKSLLGSFFQSEMQHFKGQDKGNRVQSTVEGYGIPDNYLNVHEEVKNKVLTLGDEFTEFRGLNMDPLIDMRAYEDARLLKELKEKTISDYKNLVEEVKNSYLGHSSAFISRLAHSLMFYSQMSFNSDYIRVDNLGYNNVLLIVRGGKKIFRSKSSKMFRILFPVSKTVSEFYVDDTVGKSNFILFDLNEGLFLLSPWMMIHESILADSISFYPRVLSFCILNSSPNKNFKSQINDYLINILLSFHNRRQTEVFLANMRYILLSTMGDFSGIMDIFGDFCGFNYDKLQFFIRTSIFKNYEKYYQKMRFIQANKTVNEGRLKEVGVTNIFTDHLIETTDKLTLMIYSTFLMTKGPYQRPTERAINLLGMLKIHEQFDVEVGLDSDPVEQLELTSVFLTEKMDFEYYCEQLFSNDFMVDPKYVACMGVFANSYFENLNMKDNLQTEWIKILNKEWDGLATSTGLRGRPDDVEDFWGKKGYFVVYKFLLKTPGYSENIKSLLSSDIDDNHKQKMLKALNETFLEKLNMGKDKRLLFHAVDKVQWRGSREIFVMDLDTKIMQQPIEKYMAFLCKNVDNELISIPTDKRAQVIHHAIFEKDLPLKDALTWFLTLDCSKWAPKSMFIKFVIMLLNMPILPGSFVCHFMNYSEKLFFKRIYFNVAEVEVLKNNSKYRELIDKYLTFDDMLNGYFMVMPYSWVMGIFNYTSSFMHAFNQKYASYIINKSSTQNFGEETTLVMFAHSDDSGGRLTSVSENLINRGLMLYEVQLKCCNHLLSKKKSVVSKIYFEILSIIYIFRKLLALLPKFLGGLRFTPTDKGPAHDMLQSYSKCIEVMVAGSDFSIAYLIMKFYSMMVWRFYYNSKIIDNDYRRPLQYFGMPDSHPLMVLLTGSDSDFLRISSTGGDKNLYLLNKLIEQMNLNFDDEGLIKPLKFNIKVRNVQKGFEDKIDLFSEELKSWTLGNVNFRKSPFNALNFLKKLNDPGFVGSLVNETPVRRISRAYYLRKGESIITKKGNYSLNVILTAIRITQDLSNNVEGNFNFLHKIVGEEYMEILNGANDILVESSPLMIVMRNVLAGPFKLMNYFNKLTLEGKNFMDVKRTLKPTQLQLLKSGSSFSRNFDASQLVSYIKEPQYRWCLPDLKNLPTAKDELVKLLDYLSLKIEDLDESALLKLIRMHVSKTYKDIHLYSQVPGEIRSIKTYAAMLMFLSTNSFKDKEISGLTLKLKNSLVDPGYIESSINEDIYYINTICSIIIMLLQGKYNISLTDIKIKPIKFINWEGGDILDFIYFLDSKKNILSDFVYIKLYINYINSKLTESMEISSSILKGTSYYTFLKEQKRRGGWYGSGQLMICVGESFFVFNLLGNNIQSVEANHKGKIDQTTLAFIMDTCSTCGINISSNYLLNNNKINTEMAFGYDHVNEISINEKREISRGVPYHFLKRNPLFINQLDYGTLKHIRENLFICTIDINNEINSYKIYGLKINKSNLIETIKNLFYAEDFERLLTEEGIESLHEFIITELLNEYGEDVHITKEEFFDSIFSSELYKIFKHVKIDNSHLLPKVIKTAIIPAEEGSLPRIFLNYSQDTKIDIIKNYKSYDPAILSIRSEYPENFSLILSEKLIECHGKLFTPDEDKEIINSYLEVCKIEDINQLRQKLINLMCYWGYGSLVNSINVYDFRKKKTNYSLIKMVNSKSVPLKFHSDLFTRSVPAITRAMLKFVNYYDTLEFEVKGLNENMTLISVLKQYFKFLSLSGYNYTVPINYLDLANIYFYNTLLAYLKIPEFCQELTNSFRDIIPLNTLPIDYNNRREFCALFNTLKIIFFYSLGLNYNLDFLSIIDRMPIGVSEPVNILRLFDKDLISSNEMIYHHGFCNNYMIDKLRTTIKIKSGNKVYHIKQKISPLSDVQVPMIKELKIIRPLSEEYLESENWEELNEELKFQEIDEETIEALWEEKDVDPYVKKETHFKKDKVFLTLNWVIQPYNEGKKKFSNFLRQVGENVALITNSLHGMEEFPNSHRFLVNFSEVVGGDLPDCVVCVFGNKALNKQFWKDLLGENDINIHDEQLEPLYLKSINTKEGISTTDSFGALTSEKILTENVNDLMEQIKDDDEEDEIQKTNDDDQSNQKVKSEIDLKLEKAVEENIINLEIAERLKQKYTEINKTPGLVKEDIIASLLEEIDMNMLNSVFLKTFDLGLTKDEVIKIYQTPEHFGLARSTDLPDKNPIMNSKLRAELESFCVGLSSKIASGTLTISKGVIRLVKSSFKIWKTYVLATSFLKENKKFLLKLMNSIINSAFLVDDNGDDYIWQNLINNVQQLIAQDEMEEDSDDDSYIQFDYNISQSSRLKYRFSGYQ